MSKSKKTNAMLKKLLFLPVILWWFAACSPSVFNKVYHKHDEIKKENISVYNYSGKASSIFKKSWGYPVSIQFKDIKGPDRHLATLDLTFNIEPQKSVSDTLYLKTGGEVFEIKASRMDVVGKQLMHHRTNTEISKDKNKDHKRNKEQIQTDEYFESYELESIHLKFRLPEALLTKLKTSDQMLLQFYVDESPYAVKFKHIVLSKIKKVYGLIEN